MSRRGSETRLGLSCLGFQIGIYVPGSYMYRSRNAWKCNPRREQVRRTCKCKRRFSTDILKAQLRWLGHILRRPPEHPLRLVLFEPGPNLRPRLSGTTYKKKVGRPREDWAQSLLGRLCTFTSKTRAEILTLVQDKRIYHR